MRLSKTSTTTLGRDMEPIELLDRLGYDEAWIGEHHSAGVGDYRIARDLSSPLQRSAPNTSSLGTGVVSLPYHSPTHGRRTNDASSTI